MEAQRLADELGNDKLIPQFPFAGFKIDIVYDSKILGVPKVAIECDGAKYHSSREAYLYDRHRQKILENYGFVFHRIWSTNWWRNPKQETEQLINFIKSVKAKKETSLADNSNTKLAFTDDIGAIEIHLGKQLSFTDDKELSTIKTIGKASGKIEESTKHGIQLHNKVRVKYLNNGKDLIIRIVESRNNTQSDGIQEINIKSPLATSILGHDVGDIVKVGNLDNFIEIVEVIN